MKVNSRLKFNYAETKTKLFGTYCNSLKEPNDWKKGQKTNIKTNSHLRKRVNTICGNNQGWI